MSAPPELESPNRVDVVSSLPVPLPDASGEGGDDWMQQTSDGAAPYVDPLEHANEADPINDHQQGESAETLPVTSKPPTPCRGPAVPVTAVPEAADLGQPTAPATVGSSRPVTLGSGGGKANSLIARLAAKRIQLASEPVLSEDSVATVDATVSALAELRVLLAAAALEENGGEKPTKAHRPEDASQLTETERTEISKQIKRLLKWNLQENKDNTEEVFCGVVCSLALLRGQVSPLPDAAEDALKLEETAQQTYLDLFTNPPFTQAQWTATVKEFVQIAQNQQQAQQQQSANVPSRHGSTTHAPPSHRTSDHRSNNDNGYTTPMAEPKLPQTHSNYGFNHGELRNILAAHPPENKDMLLMQIYMLKQGVCLADAVAEMRISTATLYRRDPYKFGRLLDRNRGPDSFASVSTVHPTIPPSWNVTCRLISFIRTKQDSTSELGYVAVITDLRGIPVYTGNTIRNTERDAWASARSEVGRGASAWFMGPAANKYFVGPPSLRGDPRVMTTVERNDGEAKQQNDLMNRLLQPAEDLCRRCEQFRVFQQNGLANLQYLSAARFIAWAVGASRNPDRR